MKRLLLLAAVLMIAAPACNKPENPGESEKKIALSANPSSLSFDEKAATKTVTLSCSSEPSSIKSKDTKWCNINLGAFSGTSMTVDVTVTENTGTTERSTYINIIGNQESLMIPVTQGIKKIELKVSASSVDAESYGLGSEFTVTSSSQPEVTSSVKWVSLKTGSIADDHTTAVTLYVGANRTTSARSGEITIKCGTDTKTVKVSQKAWAEPKTASTTAVTPAMVHEAFRMGWDMGNHLDGYNSQLVASETAWGNSKCTQATMDGLKKAGFSSIRIPITWMGHIGEAPTYELDETWLNRVAEIVDYAEKAGLKAIINTHHDENHDDEAEHWQDIKGAAASSSKNETIKDEIFCVWTQIALKFKDKGEWLVFEPFNEINDGGWGWSSDYQNNPDTQNKILNEWNQVFVDAVRATGGENATRWISAVGYCASPDFTIKGLVIPKDYTSANRLLVGVHDYDPYNFTLNDPLVEQWGHTADPAKRCSDKDEANVVATFDQIKAAYIDKGIPVYIGEMGCSYHSGDNYLFMKYYLEYFCKAGADRGLPMFLWDNGAKGDGSECHSYIDHGTGAYQNDKAKELIDLMVRAHNDTDPAYTLDSVWDRAPVL